jgi:hypothetical protein
MVLPTEFTNRARKPWPKSAASNAAPLGITVIAGYHLLLPAPKLNKPFPDDCSLLASEVIFCAGA